MVIPLLAQGVRDGPSSIPYLSPMLKTAAGVSVVVLLKRYFGGATNKSTRTMHSKVIMVTGGTSGIGAAVVRDLAFRGAQIILLTKHSPSDPFLVDYVEDLRSTTGNELIYAEQVDLSSLHSIRVFATKWVDNAPPRRLDMVILCANTVSPASSKAAAAAGRAHLTTDGLNEEWQVNYLANYHLLSILSPALRAQPPDRDVRIIFSTCSSYIGAGLDFDRLEEATTTAMVKGQKSTEKKASTSNKKKDKPSKPPPSSSSASSSSSSNMTMSGTSKLALMIFAHSFQQHLSGYDRPDKKPTNTRVLLVDPALSRTPGTRSWLTRGSLLGLLLYLLTWPIWWLVLKSADQGAQSYLLAAMEAGFSAVGGVDTLHPFGDGGGATTAGRGTKVGVSGKKLIKECKEREILRNEVWDEGVGKRLWEFSQGQIERVEKESAVRRAVEKKRKEEEEEKKKGEKTGTEKGKGRRKA